VLTEGPGGTPFAEFLSPPHPNPFASFEFFASQLKESLMSSTESHILSGGNSPGPDGSPSGKEYDDDVSYIAECIKEGKCILFLGSAIHAPSPTGSKYDYPNDKCPPIGAQLSERLAVACGYPDQDRWNLQRVAWFYEHTMQFRSRLVDEVRSAVYTGREPSPVLRGLARLRFPVVITTNYDQLYEDSLNLFARESAIAGGASQEEAKEVEAVFDRSIYSPRSTVKTKDCAENPSTDRPYLLKIHGDIKYPESIVITDEDYIQFVLRMGDEDPYRPIGRNLLTHLMTWPTLFIGYRLSDYNLRLLFKTLRWKLDAADIPPTFSVDRQPDVLIRDVWQLQRRYIRFIQKDLWNFVPDLYQKVTGEEMPL